MEKRIIIFLSYKRKKSCCFTCERNIPVALLGPDTATAHRISQSLPKLRCGLMWLAHLRVTCCMRHVNEAAESV